MLGNVLSLFDGISGGQVALDRLGIKYENYYASEIDKYAIQITQKNYPKTIQIGDVTKVKASDLPKIDLLMGGSPCQGFSIANQNRKNLVFNEYGVCSDERSKLFFEFVRLLKETKPDWWFLENVRMKKEHMEIVNKVLSDAVGYEVKPYLVNSSVRSGQNRLRYYWTNIPFDNNLEDWGIKLKDILEPIPFSKDYPNYLKLPIVRKKTGATKKTRGEMVRSIDDEKSFTVNATMWKGQKSSYVKAQEINPFRPCEPREVKKDSLCHHVADATDINGHDYLKRVYGGEGKAPTLTSMGGGNTEPKVLVVPEKVKVRKHEVDIKKLQSILRQHRLPIKEISEKLNVKKTTVEHWFRTDNCFSIPDAEIWFDLKKLLNIETNEFDLPITEFEIRDGRYEMADRVYNPKYKSPTIVSSNVPKVLVPPKEVQECIDKGMKNVAFTETRTEQAKQLRKEHMAKYKKDFSPRRAKVLQPRTDGKKNCITASMTKEHTVIDNNWYYRKLTPTECSRLQTFPDGYCDGISNSQQYRALGNSFTVAIIMEFFKNIR